MNLLALKFRRLDGDGVMRRKNGVSQSREVGRAFARERSWVRQAAWAGILWGLLGGCSFEWQRPGTTSDQRRWDEGRCADYAQTNYLSARQRFDGRLIRRKIGGIIVHEYEHPPASLIQSQLFIECMEKKGYTAMRKKPE